MTNSEETYVKYFGHVYAFLVSLCRDDRLAEELTQETFARAIKNSREFSERCLPETWLCSIAKNCYFDYCRKEKRIVLGDVPESAGEPLEKLITEREGLMRVHSALHSLQEPYNEVFTLRVFGGLDYGEIAALFEKSETWGRVTFYRAKQKLQETLGKDGYDGE
ncbi:MAG: RNA polymerase sigma factor [Eubacteriales bacterium]|nr:RNA polymerase sigma factor [Eubacteriales bacterium]